MYFMIKRLSQRGDTIMEVMICVAVVGLILTSAFILSNSSQSYQRGAQERNEAVAIAQSQLEKLRNYADTHVLPTATATSNKAFCVVDQSTYTTFTANPATAAANDTNLATYPTECKDINSAGQFRYAIWPPGTFPGAASNKYTVTMRWVSPTGDGIDHLDMYYEIYDSNNPNFAAGAPSPVCSDGVDNDNDGKIDFSPPPGYSADPGCASATGASETNPICNNAGEPGAANGGDEDGDGLKDYPADLGCSSLTDNTEENPACSNKNETSAPGAGDDDGDGRKDYPADPGCASANDTDERGNPACDNKNESGAPGAGDDDGDGVKDYPADRGCTSLTDNDETDPSNIAPFDWSKNGNQYGFCQAMEAIIGDGADGCFTTGNSLFSRRNIYWGNYDTTGVLDGTATLEIKYREYNDPTPAPAGYSYGINFWIGGSGGETFYMPAGSPNVQQTYTKTIYIDRLSPGILFQWGNNGGSDPDLQIDSIRIYRP